jgi:hypothetical protein
MAHQQKKESHPSDGTPFTIRSNLILAARQVFWLSDQPENVSLPTGLDKISGSGRLSP